MKKYNVAVVGATGMVGNKFLEVLAERNLPVENYYLYASAKSAGKVIDFMGKPHTVIELTKENVVNKKIDIALFSAGASVSKEFAPIFASIGATVVDNSSCWRMDENVPLVVPEVNPEDVRWNKGIIANPNCSTIQAMVALKPLHDKYTIKRVVYSTYQAVSGAGVQGYNDLKDGINGVPPKKFNHQIFANCLPQIDVFCDNHYTKEEMKMVNETVKIFNDPTVKVTATCARVPVFYCHAESVNVETEKKITPKEARVMLSQAPGVRVFDNPRELMYPMPAYCVGEDATYVGRIREDETIPNGLNMWIVADNVRKGAALNAVQIAEELLRRDLVRVRDKNVFLR